MTFEELGKEVEQALYEVGLDAEIIPDACTSDMRVIGIVCEGEPYFVQVIPA